jgi:DNA-binding CsgD family transcriptional regulator
MAQLLHHGFERHEGGAGNSFAAAAPAILYIQDLLALFTDALRLEGVERHLCCMVAETGEFLPLVGNDLTLPDAPVSTVFDIEADAIDGTPLLVRLAVASQAIGAGRRARLRLLGIVYALHALPLIEAAEDGQRGGSILTTRESHCLRRAASGDSSFDIGEWLEVSPLAVKLLLRRAAARLGTSTTT